MIGARQAAFSTACAMPWACSRETAAMTDLLEIALPIATSDPEAEPVRLAAELFDHHVPGGAILELAGFGEYGETDDVRLTVRGYMLDTPDHRALAIDLQAAIQALPAATWYGDLHVRTLAEADWAEAWKAHYHAQRLGQHLVVSPTWENPETQPGDQIVWLDPGMAFGTGAHPSTRLILILLEKYLRPGMTMLDVGTGSGVLAIAAARLGATHIHATDIDPLAIEVAAANCRFNRVDAFVTLEVGSTPSGGQFDLICANILADVVADLLVRERLDERLRPGGVILLAGIIAPLSHLVDLAVAARGLVVCDSLREGDWLALAVRRA